MGAARPQTPRRSPRQRSGGNVKCASFPAWVKRAGTGGSWRADFWDYGRKCSFREGPGIGSGWKVVKSEMDGAGRELKI
jgi:hypothetical protein